MSKDNTGIKSILNIHTPRRVVAKKPRPSVQEMLEHEDQMNIYDPYWWLPDTPEVLLKPQETPKNKSGETPAQKEKMINDWLTRPPSPYDKATKKKIVDKHYKYEGWANDKVERLKEPKKKPLHILSYIDKMNVAYSGQEKRKYDDQGQPFKKYEVRPERKQKARNNTTREKTDGQV